MAAMGTAEQIINALLALKPGATWHLSGLEYSGLDWSDEPTQSKPTEQEILDQIAL